MNRWSVSSERLPVSGSCGTDIELVPTATQVDVGRPGPGRARGDEQRVLSGGRDRDRGARQRRSLERVRRGRVVDVDDGRRRLGDRDGRRLGEAQDLDAEVGPERQDDDRQQGDDDDARREGQALARRGDRLRHDDGRGDFLGIAALVPPLEQDVFRVETEIERVVAQEPLRVDRPGQLLVVAALECAEIAGTDLGVALGAIEVDALALAGRVEPFGKASGRARRRRPGQRRTGRLRLLA